MVYLDNAATTFPKPQEVYENVDWMQRNMAVNVGRGSYKAARDAGDILIDAKILLAKLVQINEADKVFFTPSATIAANEIIGGIQWDNLKNVYVSPFEHNAIMRPLELMRKKYGFSIYVLPFDVETQALKEDEMIRSFSNREPDYVFINHVSNVTGTILPIDIIGAEVKKHGGKVIVDGSQSVGLLNIDLSTAPVDYLIFAGHKNLYSSWGVGGFVMSDIDGLEPYITGGTGSDSLNMNMSGYEAGSANILAISSLRESLKWLMKTGISNIESKKKKLVKKLIDELREAGVQLYLPADLNNHTSVVSFNVSGYEPSEVGLILDQDYDIAVRTGYHCAPLVHKLIGTESSKGTVRASVSFFNTEEDVGQIVAAIKEL
jgi:Selenocysteine lyase